jgi:putative methionine-R-sulfoxide reductase with GAF domain
MNRHSLLLFLLIEIAITMVCDQRLASQDINENNFSLYTKEQGLSQITCSTFNLSSGLHYLKAKLFLPGNQWLEQIKEFDVIVLIPVWQRTWFIILLAVLLLFFVYRTLKWSTTLIRKKEAEKTQMHKLIAEEYKNLFELEQISNYFSSSLANKKNVDDVLWDVSKNLIGRLNYEDCMIYLWNEDKTRMIQKASFGPKGDPKSISNKLFDVLPGEGIVGYVMQTKEPLIIKDTRKDARYRMDDVMRLSEVCVPIIYNGELIGIIDSEHSNEDHFRERDIKILTTISTLMINKIKQIESEQSLEIKQREINIINQQLAEAQLSALQTQMNPHFIFNSLNSIKSMILQNEQQKASRYLSKFANMIRTTLNQSKEAFTTLNENMEHLANYLAMEKLRFDSSFTYRITADDDIDKEDILLPTMMIQPLAENAIWHGLIPKKGKKNLWIHFSTLGETMSCTIEDNGIGIKRSQQLKRLNRPLHKSLGLSNLRNRIKLMNEKYYTNCTLEIIDLEDLNNGKTGCCAILSFNMNINKQNL